MSFVKRRLRSIRETFATVGELLSFLTRRGQWWLMPAIVIALLAGAVLAAGHLGVFTWVYVIF